MQANANVFLFLAFLFFWLLVLTVAFVLHWIKIERHMDFSKQSGSKVSAALKEKVLGKG